METNSGTLPAVTRGATSALAGVLLLWPLLSRSEVPPYEIVRPGAGGANPSIAIPASGDHSVQNASGDLAGCRQAPGGASSFYLWRASDNSLVEASGLEQYLASSGFSPARRQVIALNNQRHVLLLSVGPGDSTSRVVLWRPEAADPTQRYTSLPPFPARPLSATLDENDRIVAYLGGHAASGWESLYHHISPGQSAWLALKAPAINPTTPGRAIYGTLTPAGTFVGYTYRGSSSAPFPVAWVWTPTSSAALSFGLSPAPTRSAILAAAPNGDVAGYLRRSSDGGAFRLFMIRAGTLVLSSSTRPSPPASMLLSARGEAAFGNQVWHVWERGGTWQQALTTLQPIEPSRPDVRPSRISGEGTILGMAADSRGRFLPCLWKAPADPATSPWDLSLIRETVPAFTRLGLWPFSIAANGSIAAQSGPTDARAIITLQPMQDTDHDGLPDAWELGNHTDPAVADAHLDPDQDGLTNLGEYHAGTEPTLRTDTDLDGLPDGWEVQRGYDPRDPADAVWDVDRDGLTTLQEFSAGTDPIGRYHLLEFGPFQVPVSPWGSTASGELSLLRLTDSEPLWIAGQTFHWLEEFGIHRAVRLKISGTTLSSIDAFEPPSSSSTEPDQSHVGVIDSAGTLLGQFYYAGWGYNQLFLHDEGAPAGPTLRLGPLPTRGGGAPLGPFNPYAYYASGLSTTPAGTRDVTGGYLHELPMPPGALPRWQWRGFRWNIESGTIVDIFPGDFPLGCSQVTSISSSPSGLVFGTFEDQQQPRYDHHSFTWNGSQFTYLTLPGESNDNPAAPPTPLVIHGVNRHGDLLGSRYDRDYTEAGEKAFFWPAGQPQPILLPTLGGGPLAPRGLNDFGHSVGSGSTVTGQVHGFLWQPSGHGAHAPGVIIDLNGALPADSPWEILEAKAINNAGDILARATKYDPTSPAGRDLDILLRPVNPDADGDGLPDDWERAFGLNASDSADGISRVNGFGRRALDYFAEGEIPQISVADRWSKKPKLLLTASSALSSYNLQWSGDLPLNGHVDIQVETTAGWSTVMTVAASVGQATINQPNPGSAAGAIQYSNPLNFRLNGDATSNESARKIRLMGRRREATRMIPGFRGFDPNLPVVYSTVSKSTSGEEEIVEPDGARTITFGSTYSGTAKSDGTGNRAEYLYQTNRTETKGGFMRTFQTKESCLESSASLSTTGSTTTRDFPTRESKSLRPTFTSHGITYAAENIFVKGATKERSAATFGGATERTRDGMMTIDYSTEPTWTRRYQFFESETAGDYATEVFVTDSGGDDHDEYGYSFIPSGLSGILISHGISPDDEWLRTAPHATSGSDWAVIWGDHWSGTISLSEPYLPRQAALDSLAQSPPLPQSVAEAHHDAFRVDLLDWSTPSGVADDLVVRRTYGPLSGNSIAGATSDGLTVWSADVDYWWESNDCPPETFLWKEDFTVADDPTTPAVEAGSETKQIRSFLAGEGRKSPRRSLSPTAAQTLGVYAIASLPVELRVDRDYNGLIDDGDGAFASFPKGLIVDVNNVVLAGSAPLNTDAVLNNSEKNSTGGFDKGKRVERLHANFPANLAADIKLRIRNPDGPLGVAFPEGNGRIRLFTGDPAPSVAIAPEASLYSFTEQERKRASVDFWIEGVEPGEVIIDLEFTIGGRTIVKTVRFEVSVPKVPANLLESNKVFSRNRVRAIKTYPRVTGASANFSLSNEPLLTWHRKRRSEVYASLWIGIETAKPTSGFATWAQTGLYARTIEGGSALQQGAKPYAEVAIDYQAFLNTKKGIFYRVAGGLKSLPNATDRKWLNQDFRVMYERAEGEWHDRIVVRTKEIGLAADEDFVAVESESDNARLRGKQFVTFQGGFEASQSVTRVPGIPSQKARLGGIQICLKETAVNPADFELIDLADTDLEIKAVSNTGDEVKREMDFSHYRIARDSPYDVLLWDKYYWIVPDNATSVSHVKRSPVDAARPGDKWEVEP